MGSQLTAIKLAGKYKVARNVSDFNNLESLAVCS